MPNLFLCYQDVTVLFENYPLRRGVPFYVIIKGTPTEALDNLVVRTRINVGSFFSVLDVQNLCKKAPEGCPLKTELQEQRLTCKTLRTCHINNHACEKQKRNDICMCS